MSEELNKEQARKDLEFMSIKIMKAYMELKELNEKIIEIYNQIK